MSDEHPASPPPTPRGADRSAETTMDTAIARVRRDSLQSSGKMEQDTEGPKLRKFAASNEARELFSKRPKQLASGRQYPLRQGSARSHTDKHGGALSIQDPAQYIKRANQVLQQEDEFSEFCLINNTVIKVQNNETILDPTVDSGEKIVSIVVICNTAEGQVRTYYDHDPSISADPMAYAILHTIDQDSNAKKTELNDRAAKELGFTQKKKEVGHTYATSDGKFLDTADLAAFSDKVEEYSDDLYLHVLKSVPADIKQADERGDIDLKLAWAELRASQKKARQAKTGAKAEPTPEEKTSPEAESSGSIPSPTKSSAPQKTYPVARTNKGVWQVTVGAKKHNAALGGGLADSPNLLGKKKGPTAQVELGSDKEGNDTYTIVKIN